MSDVIWTALVLLGIVGFLAWTVALAVGWTP